MSFISIGFMFIGAVMGAGFASGREAWQYFGIFGEQAYFGVAIEAFLFVAVGLMTSYIAIKKETTDIGKIIIPFESKFLETLIGNIVSIFVFSAAISMSAAGGSLLNQLFGIHRAVGGAIIVLLSFFTVIGDFERILGVFKYIMPILLCMVVALSLYIGFSYETPANLNIETKPSLMASSWPIAAAIYVSYNVMATIPFVSQSALRAKSKKHALMGSFMGGSFLALLGVVLIFAMLTDPKLSDKSDLPMLAFAGKIAPWAQLLISIALMIAIYAAATSGFYGLYSRINIKGVNKVNIAMVLAIIAFCVGLLGFKFLVAYMYPIEGYFGFIVISMITINFFRVFINSKRK